MLVVRGDLAGNNGCFQTPDQAVRFLRAEPGFYLWEARAPYPQNFLALRIFYV